MALVLGQDDNASLAPIHEIGQGKVDQAVVATERDRRLGTITGQRHQSLALTAGEDH
jgi:hypothetical protein